MKTPSGQKVLIVDDDLSTRILVERILVEAGYKVFAAKDGEEGLRQFHSTRPDLALLDVVMPNIDGWQVLASIRQLSDIPIIMLTSKDCDEDIIQGLDLGADDYLTKPFNPKILLSRIRAALRRTAQNAPFSTGPTYSDDYLTIDLLDHRVLVKGEPVKLSTKEFGLLAYLVENAGHLVTAAQILERVWGFEFRDEADYVRVYITHLRQKLEPDPKNYKYFETEHGTGYRFVKQTA